MDITNLLTQRVELRLGDKSWPLLLTHRVLLEIEATLGVSILNGELDIVRVSAKALRTILFVALSHSGATFTMQEIGSHIGLSGLGLARQRLLEAWIAAMPEKDEDEGGSERVKRRSWLEVWANNRHYLQLTNDEWLEMTPRMTQALDRQRREDRRRLDLNFSRLAATIANMAGKQVTKPVRDDAYMLDPWPRKEIKPDSPEYWDRVFGIDGDSAAFIKKGYKQRPN